MKKSLSILPILLGLSSAHAQTISPLIPLQNLTATTGSIGGNPLLAGACTSGTVSVPNSTTSMGVVATPSAYPGDGIWWEGYVSSSGTVTVEVCAAISATPASETYNVRVIQ